MWYNLLNQFLSIVDMFENKLIYGLFFVDFVDKVSSY